MARFTEGAYLMTHPFTVGTAESSAKKSPYLYISGIITKVAHDGEWLDVNDPEERQVDLYMTGGAIDISVRQLAKLGYNGNFGAPALDQAKIASGIIVYCRHETQDGKTYEKWSLEQGFKRDNKPVTSDTVRRLNEQYRAAQSRATAASPTTSPAPAPSMPPIPPAGGSPPAPSEDGIPF